MVIWFLAQTGRFRPAGLAAMRPEWGACSFTSNGPAAVHVVPCPKNWPVVLSWWLGRGGRTRRLPAPRPDVVLIDPTLRVPSTVTARLAAETGVPCFSPFAWRLEALARMVGPRADTSQAWILWPAGLSVQAPAQALTRTALGYLARLSREVYLTHLGPKQASGRAGAHSFRDLEDVRQAILEASGTPCHVAADGAGPALLAAEGESPLLAYLAEDGETPVVIDAAGLSETAGPARMAWERPSGAALVSVGALLPRSFTFSAPSWPLALALAAGVQGGGEDGMGERPLPAGVAEALALAQMGPAGERMAQRLARRPAALESLPEAVPAYTRVARDLVPTHLRWTWRNLNFLTKAGNPA